MNYFRRTAVRPLSCPFSRKGVSRYVRTTGGTAWLMSAQRISVHCYKTISPRQETQALARTKILAVLIFSSNCTSNGHPYMFQKASFIEFQTALESVNLESLWIDLVGWRPTELLRLLRACHSFTEARGPACMAKNPQILHLRPQLDGAALLESSV